MSKWNHLESRLRQFRTCTPNRQIAAEMSQNGFLWTPLLTASSAELLHLGRRPTLSDSSAPPRTRPVPLNFGQLGRLGRLLLVFRENRDSTEHESKSRDHCGERQLRGKA